MQPAVKVLNVAPISSTRLFYHHRRHQQGTLAQQSLRWAQNGQGINIEDVGSNLAEQLFSYKRMMKHPQTLPSPQLISKFLLDYNVFLCF